MQRDQNGRVHSTVTDTQILGFFGDYSFLSNFATCKSGVAILGPTLNTYRFPTSEHAYMALKTKNPLQWSDLLLDNSPHYARKYGRTKVELREDWETIRITAMELAVYAKFSQNLDLLQKLISTGDKYLEETNYWGDTFWGVDSETRVGENNLGKTLMKVRQVLKFVQPNSLEFFS